MLYCNKKKSNISHIHHRQPLILNEKNIRDWLDKSFDLKREYYSDLYFHQVNNNVNNRKITKKKILSLLNKFICIILLKRPSKAKYLNILLFSKI